MKKEMPTCFLKYEGPWMELGSVSAEKFGRALIGLEGAFQKLLRRDDRLKNQKIYLELQEAHHSDFKALFTVAQIAIIAEILGVREFTKKFFGEIGTQLALKVFSRGKNLEKMDRPVIINGNVLVKVVNINKETKEVNAESLKNFEEGLLDDELSLVSEVLDKGKIDLMRYGYQYEDLQDEVYVTEGDKDLFALPVIQPPDLEEEFNEELAEEIPAVRGRLVTYQALATKYPFRFQPKEKYDLFGRGLVACLLADERRRDDYIELMKSYVGNVVIRGRGIKDEVGLFRKIKIESVEKDEIPRLFKT